MQLEKQKKFLIQVAYICVLILIAWIFLKYGLKLVLPFVFGFLFAAILQGPIQWLKKKLHTESKFVALGVTIIFYIIVGIILALASIRIVTYVQENFPNIPLWYNNRIVPMLSDFLYSIEQVVLKADVSLFELISEWDTQIMDSLGNLVSSLSVKLIGGISNVAASLPAIFIKLLLTVISTFFIAIDYQKIVDFYLHQLSPNGRKVFLQVKEYVIGTLFVCLRSYIIIMTITFVELSIGLTLIGIKHSVLIAFCIAIFDILPVLGTGGIMAPWALIAVIAGRPKLGIAIFLLYLFITVIRNIIEPKIVSGQLGLHPVVTMVSLFVGAQLFGGIGLFGGPILISLLCYLNRNGTIHILNMDRV